MPTNFDEIIDRIGSGCAKWDGMERFCGVSPDGGIPMWVADMDFRSPDCILQAARDLTEHGIFGYRSEYAEYHEAIRWWMDTRHGWTMDPAAESFTTLGIVNALGLCLQAYTQPGDEVIIFTPVYHVFAKLIATAGRGVRECPLVLRDGIYHMDFDAYDAQMTGAEKMIVFCSPHNPGGRLWTAAEQQELAAFAARHNLLIVSDEIHHDLVFPGQKHVPFPVAAPEAQDRTIMLTAPSKTFNVAGNHAGHVTIQDAALRAPFADLMAALHMGTTLYGTSMTTAAYSPEGAAWVDDLMTYIEGNAQIFDAAVNAIPGLRSMPMQATYLAWVDFSGTGMERAEFTRRVKEEARIAPNEGPTFGTGGESFLRFNLGTQRSRVEEACDRLRGAFADLQ